MAEKPAGHILIECPNTIFHLYARDEGELSKIETFLRNIRGIKRLGLNDIYIWCNRQGILYVTKFHYRKDFSLWFNMKSYYLYFYRNSVISLRSMRDKYLLLLCMRDRQWIALRSFFLYNEETGKA